MLRDDGWCLFGSWRVEGFGFAVSIEPCGNLKFTSIEVVGLNISIASVPQAVAWLSHFEQDALRYPIMVVLGESHTGKTEWAKSLFQQPVELQIKNLTHSALLEADDFVGKSANRVVVQHPPR